MKRLICSACSLVALTLVIVFAGCGGGGYNNMQTMTPPNITVSITVANNITFLEAGGSVAITAVANGDTYGKGVTWSFSPMLGTLTNMTSSSVTYNAPATPPANDIAVTITATSVSDPTKSGAASIDVPPIVVTLAASVNPVGAGGMSQITAMVTNDPANKQVDPNSWTITPATGAGTLSGKTSTSVTYTAPITPPASDVSVTITATSVSDPTQKGTITIIFAAIRVSLSANPISVQACPAPPSCLNGTSQITATVTFDPANMGVNPASWAITSPTPAVGTLSGQTSSSVTYTAPSNVPTANLPVTITATSISGPPQSGNVTVTVLAITVSVSPSSALIPANVLVMQQFTGTVQNDPAIAGVNWTTTQGTPPTLCVSACGTFSPTNTPSGTATTYTAPAAVPSPATVAVTATSVTDSTKSGSANVTLTNGTVKLVPDSLAFGAIRTNFSGSLPVTLTNTGSTALSISSITVASTSFSQKNTCGSSVAAGVSCIITVTFAPKTFGTFSATLSITDSSSDSPQKVSLSGTGLKFRFNAVKSALVTSKTVAVPGPTGPSKVGTRVLDLVDSMRDDPFLANGAKRELLVRFWYPAAPGEACKRAEYTSPRVWSHFSDLLGIPLPEVTTNSCLDARITDGAHPVVLFTHGYTGTFTDYTFIFEDLASRGYVVASVDHTFEATAVEYPDGRFVESAFGSYLANNTRNDEQTYDFALSVRLSDLKFVVSELEQLNAGADRSFAGKLDTSRVAVAGHSLGGLTALLGIEQDSRFKAGIILDGIMPDSLFSGTQTPVFILAPGRDEWRDDERRLWGNLHGARLAVNLRGAEHMTPSDAVWLANGAIKTGTIGPEKTIAIVRNYIAAFLDANLRGKSMDPLLTGPSPDYPDAVVTTEKQLLHGEP
jgi:dienelactone hydrolase